MSRTLPKDLTSHDLLKAFAVIVMIVDHTGWYFFQEEHWFRAIGRIGFPVWFFLAGYAGGRAPSYTLYAGAAILVVGNILAGMSILPLNALATIILIRLLIDPLMKGMLASEQSMIAMSALLFFMSIPSGYLCEYGTLALIFAVLGYLCRHRPVLTWIKTRDLTIAYALFAGAAFVGFQQLYFHRSE